MRVSKWFRNSQAYPINICKLCEPYLIDSFFIHISYAVIRRSEVNPIFHPYYINYGFNKIQYFEYWRLHGGKFYLLTNSFAVDMPHPE